VIQELMTFSALINYESGFESLVRGGFDHMARLSSADFEDSESLYTDVSEVDGAVADNMLKHMWSPLGTKVAHKRYIEELER
jgi:hypothetical protein